MLVNPSDMNYKKEIAARIKRAMGDYEARHSVKLGYERLSKLCKGMLSTSRISNYANEIRMPGPAEAEILARALECDAAWLMCLNAEPKREIAPTTPEQAVLEIYRKLKQPFRSEWIDLGRKWANIAVEETKAPARHGVKTKA